MSDKKISGDSYLTIARRISFALMLDTHHATQTPLQGWWLMVKYGEVEMRLPPAPAELIAF